ncbi:MAG: protein kinase [Planctomycetes bacterium]|nr:protein kinase [Planctomycetota bacterium]
MSRTNPEPDDRPPIDRTVPYQPDAAPSGPPLPSDAPTIPGITLSHEIARGGMGVVYSGRQDFLDRRVAVKLLSRDLIGEKFAQRFRREAKILAGIKHPNIVACHSAGTTDDGQSYLVMEFIDGPNLKAWICEHGAVPIAAALRLTKSVGLALGHAHQLEVIHRDVKPENILLETLTSTALDVSFPYVPKLVDLGLARMTSETVGLGLTSPGAVMGTPTTMSPEQFDDPDSVDFRTDIYGLGCVLYEMLVGQAAFRGKKMTEIVARKRQPIGPNPCDDNASVPAAVGDLVCCMLAADREQRPKSYKDLDERIDALLQKLPKLAPPTLRPPTGVTRVSGSGAPPSSPSPSPGDKGPSGPGLLRTAEIDFLQEGLGAAPRTAFREPTPSGAPAGVPVPTPTAAVSSNALPQAFEAPPARGRSRIAMAGVAVLAIAGAAWLTFRGGEGTDTTPPGKNTPPTVAISGPDQAGLGVPGVQLHADAKDPDGDRLTYEWDGPNEVSWQNETKNAVTAVLMDGLPGEQFTLQCTVSDGKNRAVVTTKTLTVAEADFPTRQFLLGCTQGDSKWAFDPPEQGVPAWTWIDDKPLGRLSCRSLGALRTMTTTMPGETFWRIEGKLGSRVDDRDPDTYGETIVRVEFGETGYSLHCRRSGDDGDAWSIELRRARLVGGQWLADPLTDGARVVAWREADDAKEDPWGSLSLTRRRDKLAIRFGRFEENKADEMVVAVPQGIGVVKIALAVNGGAGEFRRFTLW